MFYETIDNYKQYSLVRRPDTPHLYIAWYVKSGRRWRRESTGTSDPQEAARRLKAYADARDQPFTASTDDVPLLDLISVYVDKRLEDKPGQRPGYDALRRFVQFCEYDDLVFVSELSFERQERYIAWRREQTRIRRGSPCSDGTIRRELGVLRAALADAARRSLIPKAPYILDLPEPPPKERFLTPNEFTRLLYECEETTHLWRFVMLAAHTMQRPSTIYELRCEQVDLQRGKIDFNPPGRLQNKKRRPVAPITSTLRPILEIAIAESESGWLIEWKGMPIKCVRNSFSKAAKRAGLTDVTPNTLRHTGATLAAGAGVPIRQIAGMLGHSELRTTERYAKHSPEYLQEVKRALDDVLGNAWTSQSTPREYERSQLMATQ